MSIALNHIIPLNNTYIRVGSGDRKATDIEIEILMREKTFGLKSEREVKGTSFEDINSQSLQTYRRRIKDYNPDFRYNDLEDEDFCVKTGIVSRDSLTYGGLLMLGKGEVVRRYMPHFWIEFQNPGMFAVRISDKPGKVKSVPRNPNIIAFFRYARQGENAGYGIDKILRWRKLTGLNVDFESDIMCSTVTYPLPSSKSGQKGGQITTASMLHMSGNNHNIIDVSGQNEVVRKLGTRTT